MAANSSWQSNAASAAIWAMCGAEMNRFCARHSTGRTSSSGSTVQPMRQPVMEKYLEKLLITTALGLNAAAVAIGWPYCRPW